MTSRVWTATTTVRRVRRCRKPAHEVVDARVGSGSQVRHPLCDIGTMTLGGDDRRALAAARAVAFDHGVAAERAAVVHSGSNVLVHLRPAPVVARVMTGTAVLHDDAVRWLTREVSVLEFLAPRGLAVRPSRLVAPGPHYRDGLWLTIWEWVGGHTTAALGRALRELHDALSDFAGELGDLLDLRHDIERLHRELRPTEALSAEAIAALRGRLLALSGPVFGARSPAQALHGDVSLSNLLRTEDTCRGPVQWDVASFVASLRTRGADSAFVARALEAYGWADERELAPFIAAQAVYGEIWRLYLAQRHAQPPPETRSSDPPS